MTDKKQQNIQNRRRYLAMLGAGAVATGLAGCAETSTGDDSTATESATVASAGTPTATETGTEQETPAPGSASGPTAGLDPCLRPASASTCSSPVSVSGPISSDTTWGGECDEYVVTGRVSVENGATLTVEPGTRVVFAQNTSLNVEEDSALSAVGSCGSPIVFTGEQETRGYWDGIEFYQADQTVSELTYCIVEYGGGDRFTYAGVAANVVVMEGSRVRIDNTAIRESGGYGVELDGSSVADSFTSNTVTSNDDGAVHCHPVRAGDLSDTSTYTGNDTDWVAVYGGDIGSDESLTWDAIDVPYYVVSESGITVNGHLTVAQGTTVEFGQNAWMSMDDSGPGRLTAVGTDTEPITFTGEQATQGYWDGIEFYGSNRTENRIHYCVVEYAGGDRFTYAQVAANITVQEGSRLSLQNSTVRESAGYAVDVDGDSTLTESNNTFTNNAGGGIDY